MRRKKRGGAIILNIFVVGRRGGGGEDLGVGGLGGGEGGRGEKKNKRKSTNCCSIVISRLPLYVSCVDVTLRKEYKNRKAQNKTRNEINREMVRW